MAVTNRIKRYVSTSSKTFLHILLTTSDFEFWTSP